jgi:ribosomal protein S12 methylthiotransferase accessory factor
VSPDETVHRLESLLIDLGITRVADVTGMDRIGIPTAMVVRPNSRSVVVSHGKGATVMAAKAAALMDAVERHHAERVECALRLCSATELRAEHRTLDAEGAAHACSPSESILWAEGRALDGSVMWVPLGLVHLDMRRPAPLGCDTFAVGSDGLGAGNTLEEAIVQGVCEVVERDAMRLFRERPEVERKRRRLDVESVDDPVCRDLLSRYAGANVETAVWDLTSDLRIPCFLCCVQDDAAATPRVGLVYGTGCHPNRAIALTRALCEAAQRRITRIVGLRDDADVLAGEAERSRELEQQRLAFESNAPRSTRYPDVPTFDGPSVDDDIIWLQQRFDTANVTVASVDLSRPKYPVHVVRSVATGLGAHAKRAAADRGAA